MSHNGSTNTIAPVNLNSVASVSSSRLKPTTATTTTTTTTSSTTEANNKPAVSSKAANRSTDMNREWDQVSRKLK